MFKYPNPLYTWHLVPCIQKLSMEVEKFKKSERLLPKKDLLWVLE